MARVIRIVRYVTADGTDPFDAWFRIQSAEIRARIQTRLDRVELGNFGDHRGVGRACSSCGSTEAPATASTMAGTEMTGSSS